MSEKEWDIWCEGYQATGEYSTANFEGKFVGDNFDEAVENYLSSKERTDFPDIRKYYTKTERYGERNSDGVMPKITWHSIWACRLYDNETDARKGFG